MRAMSLTTPVITGTWLASVRAARVVGGEEQTALEDAVGHVWGTGEAVEEALEGVERQQFVEGSTVAPGLALQVPGRCARRWSRGWGWSQRYLQRGA